MGALRLALLLLTITVTIGIHECDSTTSKKVRVDRKRGNKEMVVIGGRNHFIDVDNAVNWQDADKKCKDVMMQLISFDTKEKNDLVYEWLNDNPDFNYWLWTSGRRDADTWVWTGKGEEFSYFNWAFGHPMDTSPPVCVNFAASLGGWEDDNCDYEMYTICEEL